MPRYVGLLVCLPCLPVPYVSTMFSHVFSCSSLFCLSLRISDTNVIVERSRTGSAVDMGGRRLPVEYRNTRMLPKQFAC